MSSINWNFPKTNKHYKSVSWSRIFCPGTSLVVPVIKIALSQCMGQWVWNPSRELGSHMPFGTCPHHKKTKKWWPQQLQKELPCGQYRFSLDLYIVFKQVCTPSRARTILEGQRLKRKQSDINNLVVPLQWKCES